MLEREDSHVVRSSEPEEPGWTLAGLRWKPSSADWARIVRDHWLEASALAAALALAVAVRVVKLGSVPRIVTADEADNLQTAYHIIAGTGPGFIGFDWKPAPSFSLYPLAWSIQVFGDSISDFRMFSVILGLLTILLFYVLARQSMGAPAALAALVLLATNLWFLHFSRTAWENVNASLFAVGACWATMRALKTQRWWWWIMAGVFVAFGFYGYFTGRFIFVSVTLIAVLAVVLKQAPWRSTAMGLALAGIVSAALFAPMANKIIDQWDFFNRRTQNVSVFSTQEPYEGDTDGWVIAAKNVGRNYKAFVLQDGSETQRGLWSRYNPRTRAPLDFVATHLFWAGLVVAAIRWRKTYPWWTFFAPLFIAEVFSRGSPDLARGVIIAPFYFLFIGMFFQELFRHFHRPVTQRIAGLGIVAVVAFVAATNLNDYFDWQDDPVTQRSRMPGIALCEFDGWRTLAREAAAAGPANLNPSDAEALRLELNCSPEIREWLQLPLPRAEGFVERPTTIPSASPTLAPEDAAAGEERDQIRQHDLAALREALAEYLQENGSYPDTGGGIQSLCAFADLDAGCALRDILAALPQDPLGDRSNDGYWYSSTGTEFTLYARRESTKFAECPEHPSHLGEIDSLFCVQGP